MTEWLVQQQVPLSQVMVLLIILEHRFTANVGINLMYKLWAMVAFIRRPCCSELTVLTIRPCAYHHIISLFRVLLTRFPARATQRHTVVQSHIITYISGFTNHHTHPVVDKKATS